MSRAPLALAVLAIAGVVCPVLWLAAGPVATDDAWWHLAMGRAFSAEGPWPGADPLLHTARAEAPIQHEWLFGVTVYAWHVVTGFSGLRVLHALAVVGIVTLVFSMLRDARDGVRGNSPEDRFSAALVACAGTTIFVVLSWPRLIQLRPDLVTIPATLLVYRLLLEGDLAPSWRRVLAAVGLLVVWANMHSLFAIALILLAVACVAMLAARLGPSAAGVDPSRERARLRRVAAALGLAAVGTLVNPRGIEHHLMFLTSAGQGAIWLIADEWSPFHPFAPGDNVAAVSGLSWLATDVVLALFTAVASIAVYARFGGPAASRSRAATLRDLDPVDLALGVASCVAMLVAIRFLWMAVFPLLFLVRALHAARPNAQLARGKLAWVLASASVVLALALPFQDSFANAAGMRPRRIGVYLRTPYVTGKYHVEGVRFLAEAGVVGNLFNTYSMGGFLGYWLSPALRTFIDGRTDDYPRGVLYDYQRILFLRGSEAGRTYLELLDDYEVDFFFGVGWPVAPDHRPEHVFTTSHLVDVSGWIPVFRSLDHAIYLRDLPRNRENLHRIAEWYAREGVDFDRVRGVAPQAMAFEHPEWALRMRLVPPDWPATLRAASEGDPAATASTSLTQLLWGEYAAALDRDAELERVGPGLQVSARAAALRRAAYALLWLGRPLEAYSRAIQHAELLPDDPRTASFVALSRRYLERSRDSSRREHALRRDVPLRALAHALPLLTGSELWTLQTVQSGQDQ